MPRGNFEPLSATPVTDKVTTFNFTATNWEQVSRVRSYGGSGEVTATPVRCSHTRVGSSAFFPPEESITVSEMTMGDAGSTREKQNTSEW